MRLGKRRSPGKPATLTIDTGNAADEKTTRRDTLSQLDSPPWHAQHAVDGVMHDPEISNGKSGSGAQMAIGRRVSPDSSPLSSRPRSIPGSCKTTDTAKPFSDLSNHSKNTSSSRRSNNIRPIKTDGSHIPGMESYTNDIRKLELDLSPSSSTASGGWFSKVMDWGPRATAEKRPGGKHVKSRSSRGGEDFSQYHREMSEEGKQRHPKGGNYTRAEQARRIREMPKKAPVVAPVGAMDESLLLYGAEASVDDVHYPTIEVSADNSVHIESIQSGPSVEWTPPDSAYGAAIPVCGWIPKKIRQAIEYSTVSLLLFATLFFIVHTSIRLSNETKDSGETSDASSESKWMTDDYYFDDVYDANGGGNDDY
eukprot:scaffold72447_cov54-Attheya_sp.AAC.6